MSVYCWRKFFGWLPDDIYLKGMYYLKMKRGLDLKNPVRFSEKLQWLKLYDRNPRYTSMVDKAEAKDVAASIIGDSYIIKTLGVWDNFDDIDFEKLPEKFVLKTTHGGGGSDVLICRDRSILDVPAVKRKFQKAMKKDLYKRYREWPYKHVRKRIIAEELLETEDGSALNDYKFFCFDGEPEYMLVSSGRFKGKTCFDYYDIDFNPLPFSQGGPRSGLTFAKPGNYDLMLEIARKLSKGIPHVRIDLYEHKGKVYFGEFTFFDSSGFKRFSPEEWDRKIGDLCRLPEKYQSTGG